jgi:(p)ppGpp synthase/HD superfamily hydrolase
MLVDSKILAKAEQIARAVHYLQTEEATGDPYIEHVKRVVGLVEGNDAKAVAWLHDVIEDSLIESGDLIRAGMPETIVAAVCRLTRPSHVPYTEYVEAIRRCGDELALMVKIADLRDHLRPNCPVSLRRRYEKAMIALAA